jgi:hypothetical protein
MTDVLSQLGAWFDSPAVNNDLTALARIIHPLQDALVPVWHPLGFIHVKLAAPSADQTYRLHLWPAEYQHPDEQPEKIHDHLFSITSRVVCGEVTNVRYEFLPAPSGDWRELRVRYGAAQSELYETGVRGSLLKLHSQLLSAPALYRVPKFELHETVPSRTLDALTVVRTEAAEVYEPRAIFASASPLPHARIPVRCEKGLWLSLLRKLIPV